MGDLYTVEEEGTGDDVKYVIVNRKVGYVVRECDDKREAGMLAAAFNHKAAQADDPDPDPNPDPADPKAPKGPKDPPPPKNPPAPPEPDPKDPPVDPEPKPKARSRYWGEVE